MLSIFLAYSLAIEMLSSFSGGHFLEVSRNIKDIKPISITFDDGPHRIRTMKILDILKSEDVPATFFVVGNRVTKEWDILRRMVREWYKIGNHSFSHPQFPKLWWGKIMEEVIFTNISIWLQTWEYPKYFRFPYGLGDKRVSLFFGGKNIGWNVDGNDWKEKNPKRLVDTIINQTRSGSNILLHDIRRYCTSTSLDYKNTQIQMIYLCKPGRSSSEARNKNWKKMNLGKCNEKYTHPKNGEKK